MNKYDGIAYNEIVYVHKYKRWFKTNIESIFLMEDGYQYVLDLISDNHHGTISCTRDEIKTENQFRTIKIKKLLNENKEN